MATEKTPLLAQGASKAPVLGCIKEAAGENRVSLSPDVTKSLIKDGYTVVVESGCGVRAFFRDRDYEEAGAQITTRNEVFGRSNIIFTIIPPSADFKALLGKTVVGCVSRLTPDGKRMVEDATSHGLTLLDVCAVPRITIAQKLDVLSSQAKVAGIRAVIEASHSFKRFQAAEITAAGKYPPSQTFVLGCGVAGLAAIGHAKAMGSVVRAWDVRDVSDQAASLGAGWVKVDFKESCDGEGGYAKESSAEFKEAQRATFHKVLKDVDIVISTAAIPGKPSPTLIEAYMVKDMKPGSVIVDLAALSGGNCALTKKDEIYTTENGVTIIGYTALPGLMPGQASSMFSQNMLSLVRHVAKKDPSRLHSSISEELDAGESGDIIVRSIVCCRDGVACVMPTPPAPTAPPKPAQIEKKGKLAEEKNPFADELLSVTIFTLCMGALVGTGIAVSKELIATFVLAGFAGYNVVWGVVPALHTPLMSVTNAISGLTAVGGVILLGKAMPEVSEGAPLVGKQLSNVESVLGIISVVVSCVNIFGGFLVSKRMLDLFKRAGDADYSFLWIAPGLFFVALTFMLSKDVQIVETLCGFMCIVAIGCLASMKTASAGCTIGMSAVGAAMVATMYELPSRHALYVCLVCLGIGLVGGGAVGLNVDPIKLPQTVAAFHSLVGLAAMFTCIGSFVEKKEFGYTMENAFGLLGNFVGGITFTGSIIAFLKLDGRISSSPWNLPCKNFINLLCLSGFFALAAKLLMSTTMEECLFLHWAIAGLAAWMGIHLVASVGGGDMPVCITVLNSYSGWALVAEGFMLKSYLLTIVGSLIGFSGAILTHIMCVAMNRQITNVIFGGITNTASTGSSNEVEEEHKEMEPDQIAEAIADAKDVLIIPGYGMAVARAQSQVAAIARACSENGVRLRFGIHPVAGRMPGQMNVLLAEAGVPYDWVFELDEVNHEMDKVDVCLVVGANDITNIAAKENEGCAIYGMPVFSVWECKTTVFFKRSLRAGYADLPNPCFFKANAYMCFGNADKTCDQIASRLKACFESRC